MADTNVVPKNTYKVPKAQWKKWSEVARDVFNDLYYTLTRNKQSLFTHPKQVRLPKNQWRTIAWNTAWLAADAVHPPIYRSGKGKR